MSKCTGLTGSTSNQQLFDLTGNKFQQHSLTSSIAEIPHSEVVEEAGPVQYVQAYKGEGEEDPRHGVNLADTERAGLGEVFEVAVLAVAPQTVEEHLPAAIPVPEGTADADDRVTIEIPGQVVLDALAPAVRGGL